MPKSPTALHCEHQPPTSLVEADARDGQHVGSETAEATGANQTLYLQRRRAAYHEAAHAAVAWRFGKVIGAAGVSLSATRAGEGSTDTPAAMLLPINRLPEALQAAMVRRLRAECVEYLAGEAIEQRVFRVEPSAGAGSDLRRAMLLIMRVRGCNQLTAELYLIPYRRATSRLLAQADMRSAIDILARRLLVQSRLDAAEVDAVMRAAGVRALSACVFAGRGT